MGVKELLADAQAALSKRDGAATVKALEAALLLARRDAPLEIRVATLVDEVFALGVYKPSASDVAQQRALTIYVEVANLQTEAVGDGLVQRVRLEVEGAFFSIEKNDKGEVTATPLGKKPRPLGAQTYETRTPIGIAWLAIPITLPDELAAGTYRIDLKVRDLVASHAATRPVSFRLA